MSNGTQALKERLVSTLVQVGEAHHSAFEAADGEDPEWPIWYAERLREPLSTLFGTEFTSSKLVHCLMDAEAERVARDPDAEWAPYYADFLLERYASAPAPGRDRLVLYHFDRCPFCVIVREAIERLGLEVELRDIRTDPEHWRDLVTARGRPTVPVLKIDSADGTSRWMPESADIVQYLEATYG